MKRAFPPRRTLPVLMPAAERLMILHGNIGMQAFAISLRCGAIRRVRGKSLPLILTAMAAQPNWSRG